MAVTTPDQREGQHSQFHERCEAHVPRGLAHIFIQKLRHNPKRLV